MSRHLRKGKSCATLRRLSSTDTVVTRDVSVDASGVILNEIELVWFKSAQLKENYSLHWSVDGENYKMARLSAMPYSDTVKIGIEAQCPVGANTIHEALVFTVEEKSIEDLW